MQTLTKGYKKPQNGVDAGSVWFPAMEGNIQQLNDHTHNLTDGAQLAVTTQSILAANWGAVSGGLYSQLITLPAGFLYDVTDMFFRLSTGEIWYPTIIRSSASTYTIYINDNSLAVTAFYR
jgi:hypothetical protein